MIVVLDAGVSDAAVQKLCGELEALGCRCEVSRGEEEVLLGLSGPIDERRVEAVLASNSELGAALVADPGGSWVARSRRRFVSTLLGAFSLLVGAAMALPVLGFLSPPRKRLEHPTRIRAASVSQIPENTARVVRFRDRPVLLIREPGDRYSAVSAICTHMDVCRVDWDPASRLLVCPCHAGAFDVRGNVVSGPPPRPLPTFQVKVQGEHIFIQTEG